MCNNETFQENSWRLNQAKLKLAIEGRILLNGNTNESAIFTFQHIAYVHDRAGVWASDIWA